MNQTILNRLNAVDQTSLTPLVQAALNKDAVQVIDWQYEKIHGGGGDAYDTGQAGVYRFWGRATLKDEIDEIHDWQLLLKILDRSTGQLEPTQLYYWQREAVFYESKFLSTLPSGLVAPRCFGVEQPGKGISWLWLEYIVDALNNQWDLGRFGTVARHLGQFNGAWLVSENKSTLSWFSNGRVTPWLEMAAPHIERLPGLLDHPSIRRWLTPTNASRTLELWARRAELLALQGRLPKTICHHDAQRRNLFARIDHNAYSQTVAIAKNDYLPNYFGPGPYSTSHSQSGRLVDGRVVCFRQSNWPIILSIERSKPMSTQTNRTFIQNYLAALSGKEKPATIVNQYVEDAELKHHIELFEAAFPKYDLVADDIVAEADKIAVRATFRGTHTGEFFGIAPTGKAVSVSVMLIYRIANGKIVEHWMNADQMSLMQQLETIPA